MLIISWNIAGLSTTANRIHDAYRPPSAKHPSAALAAYFERHGGDIICIQEHKIPRPQLTSRSEPRQSSTVEGYESFWSCCVDDQKKGLNGVVTYARSGTVIKADAAILGSEDLDRQGRCIMTDHGAFCLFNVYAPASGGQPLAYKMRFLNALRRAMHRQRQIKPVILVGDLNIALTKLDIYWKDRAVHIQDVLEAVASPGSEQLPTWKTELAEHWPKIATTLANKEVVPTKTTNTYTSEKYDKFRLAVTVDNRRVFLGKNETTPDYCLHCYDLSEWHYLDEDRGEEVLAQEANVVRLQVLAELMAKIAGVNWDEETLRLIANTEASIRRVSPTRQWLKSILEEDGMVDAFRYFYPTAEARFTCHHQFTNRRYVNDGSRIDYTLIDKSLLPYLQKGAVDGLRCCGAPQENHLTEGAALCAATASGRFQPVSFEGGGINEATREALDTQFGLPHTGMIYTPPSFSDHIGISALFDDSLLARDQVLDDKDPTTRKTQPHKLQKSIASFFTSSSTAGAKKPGPTSRFGSSTKRPGLSAVKQPAKKRSILDHFKTSK